MRKERKQILLCTKSGTKKTKQLPVEKSEEDDISTEGSGRIIKLKLAAASACNCTPCRCRHTRPADTHTHTLGLTGKGQWAGYSTVVLSSVSCLSGEDTGRTGHTKESAAVALTCAGGGGGSAEGRRASSALSPRAVGSRREEQRQLSDSLCSRLRGRL